MTTASPPQAPRIVMPSDDAIERAAEQLAAGVTPGQVRLAVGIEHIDDILADLTTGLEAVAS